MNIRTFYRLAAAILAVLALAACGRQAKDEGPLALISGQAVDGWLSPRAVDAYRLSLSPGVLTRVEARQCGVDIGLKWTDAAGRENRVDYVTRDGVEWVSFQVDEPQTIIFEVHSYNQVKDGYYRISRTDMTEPAELDTRLLAAERLARNAIASLDSNRAEDLSKSLELFEEGRSLARAVGHDALYLWFCHQMGNLCASRILDIPAAIAHFTRMQTHAAAVGRHFEEATAFSEIGFCYARLGASELALDSFYRGLFLCRAKNDVMKEAHILLNLSAVYQGRRQFQLAIDCLDKAFPAVRQSGITARLASAWQTMGALQRDLGEPQNAAASYLRARALFESAGMRDNAYTSLISLGAIYRDQGEVEEALCYFKEALAGAMGEDKRGLRAWLLVNIGAAYVNQGRYAQAMAHLVEAAEMGVARARAEALYEMGRASFRRQEQTGEITPELRDELERAMADLYAALDLEAASPNPLLRVNALYSLAQLHQRCGGRDFEDILQEAIGIIEGQRGALASDRTRGAYFSRMLYFYELYIELLMAQDRAEPGGDFAARALGVFETAHARNLLEVLTQVARDQRRKDLLRLQDQYYRLKLALEDRVREGLGSGDESVAAVRSAFEGLRHEREEIGRAGENLVEDEVLDGREIQRSIAEPDTLILEYAMGSPTGFLWSVSKEEIRAFELPDQDVLRRLVSEVVEVLNRPPTRRDAESESRALVAMAELSRTLIGPVYPFSGRKRLAIVASGALQLTPFAALPTPGSGPLTVKQLREGSYSALADEIEIVYLPSSSVLRRIRREKAQKSRPGKELALFFDPVFELNDRRLATAQVRSAGQRGPFFRLPATRREAMAIRAIPALANAEVRLREGVAANKDSVLDPTLGDFRILHFATHGQLDAEEPSRSSLVMSFYDEGGQPIDGLLSLAEIAELDLNPDLVVLSACETALGKDLRGEGLISLARGFMFAGAPRVVATLWRVDDQSTAELMVDFYRAMLQDKRAPASALRSAKLRLRGQARWGDPYYWAGFVFIGDWR